jgi:hypothetical protein
MEKAMLTKYELKEKFLNGVTTVVFEKTDGTERVLKGTLLAEYLPAKELDLTVDTLEKERKQNENILAVWDVENNGWRSFRVDSVKRLIVG